MHGAIDFTLQAHRFTPPTTRISRCILARPIPFIRSTHMAGANLQGKKIAILATDGFEQVELLQPRRALEDAGAKTQVISPKDGKIKAWNTKEWGGDLAVDIPLKSANPDEFDALLLPGGVMNPDHLRMDQQAVAFVKHFVNERKPVAAICHGPWTLIEAGG